MDDQGRGRGAERAGGRIAYRFHARDLHLILGPAYAGAVRFRCSSMAQPRREPWH
jgi:hypothetical protein